MLVVRLGMPAIVRWHSRFAPPHSQSLFLERCYSLRHSVFASAKAQRRERRKEDYYFLEPGFKNHKSHETKKRERAGRALPVSCPLWRRRALAIPRVRRRCRPRLPVPVVRLGMPAIVRWCFAPVQRPTVRNYHNAEVIPHKTL